ncbi:MAG: bacillithiol system redox-active protein YtxJ [Crocinitomicaceae bacterium]
MFSSKKCEFLLWEHIVSVDQLREILKGAGEKPALLFKHSTRCGVSSMVLRSFENEWTTGTELCDLYYLDLLSHRAISNEVAGLTGITHQSPQVIVFTGEEILYNATHSAIDALKIQSLLMSS